MSKSFVTANLDSEKKSEEKKEQKKEERASEAIFDDNSDDFVQVDKPEEEPETTPEKSPFKAEDSALVTPDKDDGGGTEPLRKSLEGLSPQQDAKVGTLKQMFQDYDQEILCSILFEQCNGNLDASIETILKMQATDNVEEKKDSDQPEESSLVLEDAGNEASGAEGQPAGEIDKATQELIDEMLAEEQQAYMQQEEEEEQAEAAEQAARQRQQRLEQMMLEQDFEMNRKKILAKKALRRKQMGLQPGDSSPESDEEEKDMLDQLKQRFNSRMASFKQKWNKSESGLKKQQNQANQEYLQENMQTYKRNKRKSFKDLAMSENGQIEEYEFALPQKVMKSMNGGSTHSSSIDNDDSHYSPVDDDDDKPLSARSRARRANLIQVHSLSKLKKSQQIQLQGDFRVSQDSYKDESNIDFSYSDKDQKPVQDQIQEVKKEFNASMQNFKEKMKIEKQESQVKFRENKEKMGQKMDDIKAKMKAKMGSFF